MTGPEHYRQAERLVKDEYRTADSIAAAQVHATLALVAATVEMANSAAWAANVTTRALDDFTEAIQSPGGVL